MDESIPTSADLRKLEEAIKNARNAAEKGALTAMLRQGFHKALQGRSLADTLDAINALRQPAPTPDDEDAVVFNALAQLGGPSNPVGSFLWYRAQFGKEKYGVYLHPNDGRDTLKDLLDEAADGYMYALKHEMENGQRPEILEFRIACYEFLRLHASAKK
jgi:hypothetical protein